MDAWTGRITGIRASEGRTGDAEFAQLRVQRRALEAHAEAKVTAPRGTDTGAGAEAASGSADRGTCRTDPGERMTARSITLASSRMLPGQVHRLSASIVATGMLVIERPISRDSRCTK